MYDFPFSISDISYLLSLTVRRKTEFAEQVDCPFCDGHGKMRLDLTTNQFRCPKCDESGGMLKLYASINNTDTKSAYKDICSTLKIDARSMEVKQSKQVTKINKVTTNTVIADEVTLHNTYSNLLSMLTLSTKHEEQLLSRGLTRDEIVKLGYKSITNNAITKIATTLLERGCILKNVPGFYTDKYGNWHLNLPQYCSGILIPILSVEHKIKGFQIRLDWSQENGTFAAPQCNHDKPYKNTKYIWLSSSSSKGLPLENGTSSGSPIHYAGNFTDKVVYVTEGALKGDIAHFLSGKSFLCVAGVNQYSSLDTALPLLKAKGITTIVECYDMDKYTNVNVERGSLKLIEKANELGFEVHRLKWNDKYKGIDDFLQYSNNKKMTKEL